MAARARKRVAGICFAAALAGCAAPPAEAPPPVEALTELTCVLELVSTSPPAVELELSFDGAPSGETELSVARSWGGVSAGGEDLVDVAIRGAEGEMLPLERRAAHRWVAHHAPGERLAVRYALLGNRHQEDSDPAVHRRPILTERLLHLYGELALLLPGHLDEAIRRRIEIEWRGFEEAGWRAASSFGVGTRPLVIERSLWDLRQSVWVAGEIHLERRDLFGFPLWVALERREWPFEAGALADLAASVIASERAFFDDYERPFYLVSAIGVGAAREGSSHLGGTCLSDSFSLALSPDTTLETDASGRGLPGVLAHEIFHEWNGRTIRREDPEELVYWFSEGFSDFYARRLLYRSGRMDLEGYAASLDRALVELYTSPVLRAPNQRILEGFWSDRDLQRLPYARGDVVALVLDRAIRERSAGARSLDDLVRELAREARGGDLRVSTEGLLERFAREAGAEAADLVRRTVVEGEPPLLDASMLEPCLELWHEELGSFDPGFDVQRSLEEKRVRGLRPGSAAERAGLREDQELVRWSVWHGDVQRPIELTVRAGGAEQAITFLPRGEERAVPRVRMRPGARRVDCPGL